MKKLFLKNLALVFIASVLLVSCTSDENVVKDKNEYQKQESTFKFSKTVNIKDQTGLYSVDIRISSNNKEFIQNYLDTKPVIKVNLRKDIDQTINPLKTNTTTENNETNLNNETTEDLEVEILNKKIPNGYTVSLQVTNNNLLRPTQGSNTISSNSLPLIISYKDDNAKRIDMFSYKNNRGQEAYLKWIIYSGIRLSETLPVFYGPIESSTTNSLGIPNLLYYNFSLPQLKSILYKIPDTANRKGLKAKLTITADNLIYGYFIEFDNKPKITISN